MTTSNKTRMKIQLNFSPPNEPDTRLPSGPEAREP